MQESPLEPLGEARQDQDDSRVEAGKQDLNTIFKKYGIEENQASEYSSGQKAPFCLRVSPNRRRHPLGPP